jgi:PAS domain-containing protein
VFELLDDYYPHPNAGMVACDAEGRILAAGRGMFDVSGYRELDLIGRPVSEALGLHGFEDDPDPIRVALEWGVRQLDKPGLMRHAAGLETRITCDIFPGLDGDGGLLVAIAPRTD